MFAGSKVLANFLQRGLVHRGQIDDRIHYLDAAVSSRKRISTSSENHNQTDHRSSRYKSKSSYGIQGTQPIGEAMLVNRKRKADEVEGLEISREV